MPTVANIQPQLEKLVAKNYFLNISAKEAYKAYIRAYDSHSLKSIFDVNTLDLCAVSRSFGFAVPPFVDLPLASKASGSKKSNAPHGEARGQRRRQAYAPARTEFKKKQRKSIVYKAVPVKKRQDTRQFSR